MYAPLGVRTHSPHEFQDGGSQRSHFPVTARSAIAAAVLGPRPLLTKYEPFRVKR
jgi:hypothetical protein